MEPPYVPGMSWLRIDARRRPALAVGDRVLGIALPCAPAAGHSRACGGASESVVRIPSGVTFEDAATAAMNGLTRAPRVGDLLAFSGQNLAVTGAPARSVATRCVGS